MKKLLLLFLLIGIFSACRYAPKSIAVDKKPVEDKTVLIRGLKWTFSLGSDGHDYIDNGGATSYAAMHYIDCRKCLIKKLP